MMPGLTRRRNLLAALAVLGIVLESGAVIRLGLCNLMHLTQRLHCGIVGARDVLAHCCGLELTPTNHSTSPLNRALVVLANRGPERGSLPRSA